MTCIIIEDQPPAQRILKKYIQDMGSLELKATFSSALDAIDYLKVESVDLIFLDIHLPKISGFDFLQMHPNAPYIILTTAFPDYALESYEFSVVDYLLKPFSFQRFVKAIAKIPVQSIPAPTLAPAEPQSSFPKELFIKSGYEHIKVIVADICYIQSDADYTELFMKDKKHLTTHSLQQWETELDPKQFIRIHRSYMIQIDKILKVSGSQVYLSNGKALPIGRVYKDAFMKRVLK